MMASPDRADYARVLASYHDGSHFSRDARRLRAFMAMDTPHLDAAMRARAAVMGQPVAALDVKP